MEFTEHELTLAADAGARFFFTARQMPWRRSGAEERWRSLKPVEKYPFRAASGKLVLAALAALPDRAQPGEVPSFTDAELTEAAAAASAPLDLVRAAVAALPPRVDPDAALEVPDHVPDDLI